MPSSHPHAVKWPMSMSLTILLKPLKRSPRKVSAYLPHFLLPAALLSPLLSAALFQQQKREAIRGEIEDLLDTFDAQHLEPAKVERACVGLVSVLTAKNDFNGIVVLCAT